MTKETYDDAFEYVRSSARMQLCDVLDYILGRSDLSEAQRLGEITRMVTNIRKHHHGLTEPGTPLANEFADTEPLK